MYVLKYSMTQGGGFFAGFNRGREARSDDCAKAYLFASREDAHAFKTERKIRAMVTLAKG